MVSVKLIVAVDESNGIGKNNQLLCHLPRDLAHFKAITMGAPIIMGRKTFESIGRPLPGRENHVISTTITEAPGYFFHASLKEAMNVLQNVPEVFIIGGAELYKQTIIFADSLYLTRIHHTFNADIFFPHLDEDTWKLESEEYVEKDERNLYSMTFAYFVRINK